MFLNHSLKYFFHNKLSEFYIMFSLRNLGLAMINLFLPIFIFSLRNSLFDVINFLFFQFLSLIIFFPLAGKLTSKIGNAHTMLFSSPFLILFFLILYSSNQIIALLPFLGVLLGFAEAFFWMPFHSEFSFISKSKEIDKEISYYRIFGIVFSTIGPLIGSIIILFFGFSVLFLSTIILLLASQIPLLLSKDIKTRQRFYLKNIFRTKNFSDFVPHFGYGAVLITTACLWPLLLFFIVSDFFIIGYFALIVNLLSVIITFLIGKKIFNKNKKNVIKKGATIFSFTIILRAFVFNALQASMIWFLGGLLWPLFELPLESFVYSKSKRFNKLEFFVAREFSLAVGRFLVLGIVFVCLYDTMLAISTGIFVSGILMFFCYSSW